MRSWLPRRISRRGVLSAGMAAGGGSLLAGLGASHRATAQNVHAQHESGALRMSVHPSHGHMLTVGDVDGTRNGFDPMAMLTDWETGAVSQLPDGRTLRTYEIVGEDKEIEIAPGLFFPAWTYNGRVPGPTLRAT